jgi:hypothetical protein
MYMYWLELYRPLQTIGMLQTEREGSPPQHRPLPTEIPFNRDPGRLSRIIKAAKVGFAQSCTD